MSHNIFRHRHTVRFGEIDYAGIVYYPNFFDFYQQTEEEFMAFLGYPYPHMLRDLKQGFPIVHVDSDFKKPIKYGDTLEIALSVTQLGNASVTFHFDVYRLNKSTLCAEADISHVLIDTEKFVPIEIPPEMRTKFEEYLASGADQL